MSRMEAIRTNTGFIRENIDSDMPEDSGSAAIVPLDVELPEIPEAFSHLRELFFVMGQAMQTGMGLSPVTWVELKAFIEVNELELTLWERSILKKMSEAYCNEYSHASSPNRPAPYKERKEPDQVDAVAKALKMAASLAAFRKKK